MWEVHDSSQQNCSVIATGGTTRSCSLDCITLAGTDTLGRGSDKTEEIEDLPATGVTAISGQSEYYEGPCQTMCLAPINGAYDTTGMQPRNSVIAGGLVHVCTGPLDTAILSSLSDIHAEPIGVGITCPVDPANGGVVCDASECTAAKKYDHCVSPQRSCNLVMDPLMSNVRVVSRDGQRYSVAGVCFKKVKPSEGEDSGSFVCPSLEESDVVRSCVCDSNHGIDCCVSVVHCVESVEASLCCVTSEVVVQ